MAKQPRILSGQVAVITGGARGIGKETARALVAQGMKVAIGDLDLAATEQAAAELGPTVKGYQLNVTDRDSFVAFLDAAEADLGPVDVLINNAGIMQIGPFLEEDDLTAHRQVYINVHGVLYGMKIILPRFVARGRGHLVNIASSAGKGGFPGGATYCGTKHFVVGVSEAVRGELRGTNVEVSCVMPGVVNTELATGLKEARGVKNVQPQDVAEAIVDALQVPRFDVFVPKSIGPILSVMGLVPRRGREAMTRVMKADQVLASADPAARKAYELRASASEPGLDPGEHVKELTR
ncbi:SDR family oxidoreductase [Paraconexibacter antarcticus]|uniref:SDR family oxidoreductase n=1 Tax=Paraconexibacter antarcticus TaxID=2949664 RepID=A0ABY5DMM1_9ACTN|nr:SDR family oxidoreductase [Paraconexibacter antarcticus]UTI63248.1 SDR family oxidoreductase [Paraconexibacter antarcticus]